MSEDLSFQQLASEGVRLLKGAMHGIISIASSIESIYVSVCNHGRVFMLIDNIDSNLCRIADSLDEMISGHLEVAATVST